MNFKKRILVSLVLLATAPFLINASGCGDDKKDETLPLLVNLLIVSEVTNPSFKGSCFTGTGLCGNFYRTAPTGCVGATSTAKCTATNAFGACTDPTGAESVLYPGYSQCSSVASCQVFCTGANSGTWNASYTGM